MGGGKSKCKGPEVGTSLEFSRHSKEVRATAAECVRGRVEDLRQGHRGDGVGGTTRPLIPIMKSPPS